MRTRKAVINWIAPKRRRFAITIHADPDDPNSHFAVELPWDLLSLDMKEGQQITIQIDDGDRDIDT